MTGLLLFFAAVVDLVHAAAGFLVVAGIAVVFGVLARDVLRSGDPR